MYFQRQLQKASLVSYFHINDEQTAELLSLRKRSSQQGCSMKRGVLRHFVNFTGKHLSQSLFFNQVAGLKAKACNFIKKETLAQVFSSEFCEISKNAFFTEHRWTAASDETIMLIFQLSDE